MAQKRMCRDCTTKWAQEMGLCRSCQTRRIGAERAGYSLTILRELAAQSRMTVEHHSLKGYRLVRNGVVVLSADTLGTLANFLNTQPAGG